MIASGESPIIVPTSRIGFNEIHSIQLDYGNYGTEITVNKMPNLVDPVKRLTCWETCEVLTIVGGDDF